MVSSIRSIIITTLVLIYRALKPLCGGVQYCKKKITCSTFFERTALRYSIKKALYYSIIRIIRCGFKY